LVELVMFISLIKSNRPYRGSHS